MNKHIKWLAERLKTIKKLPQILLKTSLQIACGFMALAIIMLLIGKNDEGTGAFAFFIYRNLFQYAIMIAATGAAGAYFFSETMKKFDKRN